MNKDPLKEYIKESESEKPDIEILKPDIEKKFWMKTASHSRKLRHGSGTFGYGDWAVWL